MTALAHVRRLSTGTMLCLLAVGAAVDAVDVWRPVDGTVREPYRECDVAGVARNFAREGMRILYPRIDWRGDGPGYVEMEFPLYPYMIAAGYKIFGLHDQIGRVVSYLLALATVCIVIRLASYVLPPPGAVVAVLFFILDPLTVQMATAVQAEPLMLFGYVGAVYAYIRWLDDDRWSWYGWALACTALAMLAKAPAAHVGLVFVFFTLWRQGWRAFRRVRLWVLGIAAVGPGALWYAHAHQLWLTYGNSLGASNHRHVVGLATVTRSLYLTGILGLETSFAWTAAGLLAVVVALALGPRRYVFGFGLLWYVAVGLYYLVIAGTSAFGWAAYYHVVSVPPVALLIGGAAQVVLDRLREHGGPDLDARQAGRLLLLVLLTAAILQWIRPGVVLAPLAAAAVVAAAVAVYWRRAGAAVTAALAILTALAPLSAFRQTLREVHPHRFVPEYETARAFAPHIPPGVLIVVSGNYCVSASESAYNSPWYLYWTDHKGFTPCVQDHTLPIVRDLMARGARYFIADRTALAARPGFEMQMRQAFTVEAESPVAILFKLD